MKREDCKKWIKIRLANYLSKSVMGYLQGYHSLLIYQKGAKQ